MDFLKALRPMRLLGLIIALGLLTASLGQPALQPVALVSAGDQHLALGEFTLAAEAYRSADENAPGQPAVLLRRATAEEMRHHLDDAREAFTAALASPWTKPRAHAGLARIAAEQGDSYQARVLWEQAAGEAPNDTAILQGYVRFLWSLGEFHAAGPWLERILRLNTDNAEALYRSSIVLLMDGNRETAHERLTRAAQSTDAEFSGTATALLKAAAGSEAGSADFLLRTGVALLGSGEMLAAQAFFRDAYTLSPDSPVAGAYLGYCLTLTGDRAGGFGLLRDVLRTDPDYPLAWYFLGDAERKSGNLRRARADFLKVLELDPENSGACVAVGETYAAENALGDAEAWFRSAVDLAPDEGDFWLALAQFYVGHLVKVKDEGVAAAKKAVELLSDDAPAHDALGWAYFLTGDMPAAESQLSAAARLDSNDAAVQYHLGSVYYAMGNRDAAIYHLTRVLDIEAQGRYASLAEDLLRKME